MANDIVLGYPNITPPVVTHLSTTVNLSSTTNTAESGSDEHSKLTIGILATLYTLIFIIGITGWLTVTLFFLSFMFKQYFSLLNLIFQAINSIKFHHEYNVSKNIFIGTNKHNNNHDLKRLFIQSIVFRFFFRFRVKNEFYKFYKFIQYHILITVL